jgi:hypothetical protein
MSKLKERHRSDATAGFSTEAKDAAVKLVWPLFAKSVMTVEEWIQSLSGGEKL